MNTPLCMPMATLVSYSVSSNSTMPVTVALALYLLALLISALILCYLHQCSNLPPYECHTS